MKWEPQQEMKGREFIIPRAVPDDVNNLAEYTLAENVRVKPSPFRGVVEVRFTFPCACGQMHSAKETDEAIGCFSFVSYAPELVGCSGSHIFPQQTLRILREIEAGGRELEKPGDLPLA